MRLWILSLWLLTPGCGALGFVRYGLTQVRPGSLGPGSVLPAVELVALDGERRWLEESLPAHRPLVLVFGSFT